ncbi:MAG: helix-turn-helix domain-containing protein [Acetobacteraceae bacterium]|nr:helix-turn-helix domain-containing protein [Acetobacteraceae bacterium]
MPSSAVRSFTDPDDYAATIRAAQVEATVTGRGEFAAKLTQIDFHRLWIQRFSSNLPPILDVALITGRAIVAFRTASGPGLLARGLELRPTNILQHSLADSFYQRSSESGSFETMSLPVEDMVSVGEVLAGVDLTPPPDAMLIAPPPAALTRLQRLHAAAGHLAEDAPEILAHPEAARGLEQVLIAAIVDCLASREGRDNSFAQMQHAIVMRRFRRVVEENPKESLYIPQICQVIRVSQRTLRVCCQEHLGMAPKRYLLLRRMGLVRRALRHAAPDAASVTDIATRFGFWQLGRFAVAYQSLFGEAPSATLRR